MTSIVAAGAVAEAKAPNIRPKKRFPLQTVCQFLK